MAVNVIKFKLDKWWNSDAFAELDPLLRYVYLEILFRLYRNKNKWRASKGKLESLLNVSMTEPQYNQIRARFNIDEEGNWSHHTVGKNMYKKPSKTLKERRDSFISRIKEAKRDDDQPAMLNEFYVYWTTMADNGSIMKFELEKFHPWNTNRRLITWRTNHKKYGLLNSRATTRSSRNQATQSHYDEIDRLNNETKRLS